MNNNVISKRILKIASKYTYEKNEFDSSDDDDTDSLKKRLIKNAYALQCKRFKVFKEQDLENGRFDVTFEVEKKILHAHQFILATASETLNSWLTDRWMTKDQPVKIESYTFASFYEFLCFVYSGDCHITAENVRELVDMAEFFGTPFLKELCDEILSIMKNFVTFKNIGEMLEFADKYSLKEFEISIDHIICCNFEALFERESFLNRTKLFVTRMAASKPEKYPEEDFFETVYQWTEHQVMKQKRADDATGAFNLQEAIKIELYTIIPQPKFSKMNLEFLMNFVVKNGFILSPTDLSKFHQYCAGNESERFEKVYQLAERQALQKQKMSSDPDNFDVADFIKADMTEVILGVKFYMMDKNFLMHFVVANGIIREEQASHVYDIHFEVKSSGERIRGTLKDNVDICRVIRYKSPYQVPGRNIKNSKCRFFGFDLPFPKTPSTVTKMKGIDWYLCFEKDKVLTLKHESMIDQSDYLLAEMKGDTDFEYDFEFDPYGMTTLTAKCNNI